VQIAIADGCVPISVPIPCGVWVLEPPAYRKKVISCTVRDEGNHPLRSLDQRKTLPPFISFEAQPRSSRRCGAACVAMVLRSFKKMAKQGPIWAQLREAGPLGKQHIRSISVARYLTMRKLVTTVIRVKDVPKAVRTIAATELRTILVHHREAGSNEGHFTVLLSATDDDVVVHDPFVGPSRRIRFAELEQLMTPSAAGDEISPRIFITVSEHAAHGLCHRCATPLPTMIKCRECGLENAVADPSCLGCVEAACEERLFECVICQHCDRPALT